MIKRGTLLLAWFLLALAPGFEAVCAAPGGYFRVGSLSLAEGLSQASVYCTMQDSTGFMWFGTQDGLNRYDGYRFTVHRKIAGDGTSLPDNYVITLAEHPRGTLWAGTRAGLWRLDLRTGASRRVTWPSDAELPGGPGQVQTLLPWGDYLWAGVRNAGLYRVDCFGGQAVRAPFPAGARPWRSVMALAPRDRGSFWVGTEGGLARYEPATARWETVPLGAPAAPFADAALVQALLPDTDGSLWVGTRGGLCRLPPGGRAPDWLPVSPSDPAALSDANVQSLFRARDGAVWVGTRDGGVCRRDPVSARFTRFAHDPADTLSLSGSTVLSLFEDAGGVIWVGTWAAGVDRLRIVPFEYFQYVPERPHGLGGKNIRAVLCAASGLVWVGTSEQGLDCLDRRTGTFRHYRNNPSDPFSLVDNRRVWALAEGADGSIWVGTGGFGLDRMDPSTGRFSHYRHDPDRPDSLVNDFVKTLLVDPRGKVWVGTEAGLACLDPEIGRFRSYPLEKAPDGSPHPTRVDFLCLDRSGALWAASQSSGLFRLDPASGTVLSFQHDESNPASLSNNSATCIYEDRAGNLWVGTWGGGLDCLEAGAAQRGRTVFRHFTPDRGVHAYNISGITEDASGALWVSSSIGLFRLDPKTGVTGFYDRRDGFPDCNFNPVAFCRTRSSEIVLGGLAGLTILDPARFRVNTHVPTVVLTAFLKSNRPVALDVPAETLERLTLEHHDRVVSFEFSALDFSAPDKHRYAYRLEGFDKDWVYTTAANRTATFTNLDPGTYVLRVKGSNNDGVWNETGLSLTLVVTPPFWRTWYAYVAYVAAGLGLVLFLARVKSQRHQREIAFHRRELEYQRLKTEWLEKVDRLKDDFLANTSHELRTPLTSLVGYAHLVRKKLRRVVFNPECTDAARREKAAAQVLENIDILLAESRRLTILIEDLLDLNGLESNTAMWEEAPVDVGEVVESVLNELGPSFREKSLTVGVELQDAPEVPGDRARLRQVVWNLVSNAGKFTPPGGAVKVSLEYHANGDRPRSLRPGRGEFIHGPGPAEARREASRAGGGGRAPAGGEIRVTVEDTGLGLDASDCEAVFQRFRQVGDTLTAKPKGVGLGLPICKRIVEHHGGRIWAEQRPGGGAVFRFTLPLEPRVSESTGKLRRRDSGA
ncbi:MAG: hypothetical protein KA419_05120 [Acidobacteria bacterium]|nr:hypothetical protein [Acidobacteriota bacterium]